jgi:feruloyl esterase
MKHSIFARAISAGAVSAAALAAALSVVASAQAQDNACRALGELSIPNTKLTVAEVPAGPFKPPNAVGAGGLQTPPPSDVPAFCRVTGTIAPAIQFEVWLPQKGAWNGKLQTVGGGGFAGVISYGAMVPAVKAGYVTASTDTGHVAPDVEWLADKQRLVDYGYRAIHETTVQAKTLLERYYGKVADYNYFNGCSTGGRQGLMEAQRFPDDYDGIVTGAPVNYFVAIHTTQLHVALAAHPTDDAGLLAAKDLALVNRAVLAQCDAQDGVKDGVLDDPRKCSFDPAVLECAAGGSSGSECLSPEQIGALKKIYAGAKNPRTGAVIHPSLMPGGEPSWQLVTTPGLVNIPYDYFGRAVLGTPTWDWRKFDFDKDVALANQKTGEVLNAIDPDLRKFKAGGGKLVLYHGWNDQVIFPQGSINYQQSVADKVSPGKGNAGVQDFFRLFMVPGMTHCRGGTGTDTFDAQAAVEQWVEKGVAPTSIAARRMENGAVTRTRPLCPFPQVAKYDGSGDTNDASNFTCQ